MALEIPLLVFLAVMLSRSFALEENFMDRNCGYKLTLQTTGSAILKLTDSKRYSANMDCTMVIGAPTNQRLLVRFLKMNIHSVSGSCNDWIQLYDGGDVVGTDLEKTGRLCGTTEPKESYVSIGRAMTLTFYSDDFNNDGGFKLLYTTFYMEPCKGSDFKCDNGRCIAGALQCTKYDHCGDGSNLCPVVTWIVIGCVAGVVAIAAIVLVIVFIKKRQKQKRIAHSGPAHGGPAAHSIPHKRKHQRHK
ncbi:neuropilin and tolloid-like protein 1 [Gigantopelta aegis]|uniref:neuropilin and tolloid-like protein 1 n=1 Tax=Gigantopelta aegis TaxID=1735272 RepID=UPI001B889A25|nr:neuropilin and tolloid-like protein 1 [Gigantopelta aegis]